MTRRRLAGKVALTGKYTRGVDHNYTIWYNGMMVGVIAVCLLLIGQGIVTGRWNNSIFGAISAIFFIGLHLFLRE